MLSLLEAMTNPYDPTFYSLQDSIQSAQVILPLLFQWVKPKSVVDVGCGSGVWLKVAHELGVEDYLGFDGTYVTPEVLQIPPEHFRQHDLTVPLQVNRTFDLVMCLEVAEHLPPSHALGLVQSLASLGPLVLFSAAIPFQEGVSHINERWQSYWAELFAAEGYMAIDCLRRRIWRNPSVKWWYSQNALLYASKNYLQAHADSPLHTEWKQTNLDQLSMVHPMKYLEAVGMRDRSFKQTLRAVPGKFLRAARHILQGNRTGTSADVAKAGKEFFKPGHGDKS